MSKVKNKKLLFRVTRFNSKYRINATSFIKIISCRLVLFLKRIKRKLLLLTRYFKNIVPTLLFITLYLIIIYLIIKKKGFTFLDAIWDAKELIYTSVVLAIFIPYINFMKTRNKLLKKQMNDYLEIYSILSTIMINFNHLIGVDDYKNMLWSKEKNEKYYKNVLCSKKQGLIIHDKNAIFELKEQCVYLKDSLITISNSIINNDYIGSFGLPLVEYKRNLLSLSRKYEKYVYSIKEETTKELLIEKMKEFNNDFLNLLINIRKPWRWDKDIDKKIDLLISKNGECITDYDSVKYRLFDE